MKKIERCERGWRTIRAIRRMLLAATLFMLIPSMALGALTEEAFEQWYEHMTYLVDGIGARTLGTEADRLARAYLADQFERAGMIREDGTLLESACLVNGVEAVSLIGRMPAVNADARIVTVCAHYDSHTPGARDNASGVAAMLTLMSHFSALAPFPDTELRFIAFAAEEVGQLGSRAYVEGLTQDERQRSLAVFNIDILAVDVWDTETAFSSNKPQSALFESGLHASSASISRGKVGQTCARSVFSEAPVPGKNQFQFIPPPPGVGTPCRRAFSILSIMKIPNLSCGGLLFFPRQI